jgi:DNA-binding NarL/FixJ family response regulator
MAHPRAKRPSDVVMPTPLIIHERRGRWARQIRPRVNGCAVTVIETRSGHDLAAAASRSACPIVVVDLSDRGDSVASDLDQLAGASDGALVLVLDPSPDSGLAEIALQMGATRVIPATTPPPVVVEILRHWLRLAHDRSQSAGWAEDRTREPEPWEAILGIVPGGLMPSSPP